MLASWDRLLLVLVAWASVNYVMLYYFMLCYYADVTSPRVVVVLNLYESGEHEAPLPLCTNSCPYVLVTSWFDLQTAAILIKSPQ